MISQKAKFLFGRFVLIVLLGSLGVLCFAQFAGGDGSEANPWQVATAEHLDNVRDYLGELHADKYFIQTANIDLSDFLWDVENEDFINDGEGWIPIGTSQVNSFRGYYDGDGNVITGLTIKRPNSNMQGIFGQAMGGQFVNIGVEEFSVNGGSFVAGLAAYTTDMIIENCYTIGELHAVNSSGGLIGTSINSQIINCYSKSLINSAGNYVGGLVGYNSDSKIEDSYAVLEIIGDGDYSGGLVGYNTNSSISNSYTKGSLRGNGDHVGGLVGYNNNSIIGTSYSKTNLRGTGHNVGGLVGVNYSNSVIHNSYSDCELVGRNQTGGLVGYNNNSTITYSYSKSIIVGERDIVGGLVGYNVSSYISNSYNKGFVTGDRDFVGGFVGRNTTNSEITNSYSTGNVIGQVAVGGFAGDVSDNSKISFSYSTGGITGTGFELGGFAGYKSQDSTIENSYWNITTSGVDASAGGEERKTEDMTYPYGEDTYVGWDFRSTWASDVDSDINNGYPYLLEEGEVSVEDHILLPETVAVTNYPNPFNPETKIVFTLTEDSRVKLGVYNLKGQLIRDLHSSLLRKGNHSLIWDGKNDDAIEMPSGVYLYRLQTDKKDIMGKMMMLK